MFQQTKDGVVISIRVQPNASKTQIVGEHGDALKIKIHAPPVDGKANEAVVEFFAELFDCSKSCVEIVGGEKSRSKKVLIRGQNLQAIKMIINLPTTLP